MAKQVSAQLPCSSDELKTVVNTKSHGAEAFFKDARGVPAKSLDHSDEGKLNGCWSKMLSSSTSGKIRSRWSIAFKRSRSMSGRDAETASPSSLPCLPFSEQVSQDSLPDYASLGEHAVLQKRQARSHPGASLSCKYQPRRFEDIVGHEVVVRLISNAAQKKKVGNLYLFHGPSGTGKTSTARVFAMALNCQSAVSLGEPCCNCRGCSRSLYLMELCSASRTSGFRRISALVRNTSFVQAVPGFKVFIIEESQSLSEDAWEELLGLLLDEQPADLVFVLVAADERGIPKNITSRCQKFCFPRLKRMDVALKLERIVAQEDFELEREAMELIVAKADGSLREAENILDQLTLLGPRITGSTVQQLVGLVPQEKLLSLLQAAIGGDSEKTVKITRELTTAGFEAQVLVPQLTSLIADLLSGAAATDTPPNLLAGPAYNGRQQRSPSSRADSDRLCYALKLLVEAQKQPKSSVEHITWIYSTLLQIATPEIRSDEALPYRRSLESHCILEGIPQRRSQNGATLDSIGRTKPLLGDESICSSVIHGRKAVEKLADLRDLGELWQSILENVDSRDTKEFLSGHVELASLTLSAANAIVHLMFKTPRDKMTAESSEASIVNALRYALGCPVAVTMSLKPSDAGILRGFVPLTGEALAESCRRRSPQGQKPFLHKLDQAANPGAGVQPSSSASYPTSDDNLTLLKFRAGSLKGQDRAKDPMVSRTIWQEENKTGALTDPITSSIANDRASVETGHVLKNGRSKERRLSLSSTQQSDLSVQPYSQDILYENANTDRGPGAGKDVRRSIATRRIATHDVGIGYFRSWSCKEELCKRTGEA